MIIGGRFFLFHLLLLRLRHGECNEPGKCILSLVSRRQASKIEGVQWEMKWISQQHAQHSTAVGINLSLQSHWVCDWRKDKPNAESVYYYNMTKQTMFFDFCYRSKPLHMAYSKKKNWRKFHGNNKDRNQNIRMKKGARCLFPLLQTINSSSNKPNIVCHIHCT